MNAGYKKAMEQKRRIRLLESKKNKTQAEKREIKLHYKKMLVGKGTNSEESLRDFNILFPQ